MERSKRASGVELLKIIAIVMVVTCHVTNTLHLGSEYLPFNDYTLPLQRATRDPVMFILSVLRYSGVLGNTIFFVCSAYFLAGKKSGGGNVKKAVGIAVDVWLISVLFCVVIFILRGGNIPVRTLIKQFLPNTFANNWYMTCYILFLLAYPYFNRLIDGMSKAELLRAALALSFLYLIMGFVKKSLFFSSAIVVWTAIYFLVSYLKLYQAERMDSVRFNVILLIFAAVCYVGAILALNVLGLRFKPFAGQLMRFKVNSNPFGVLMAIALLNLFRKLRFSSRAVNYIASLSMPIYLIHENFLFKKYYRPYVWKYIYDHFGYDHVLLWTIAFVICLFTASALLAAAYKETLGRAARAARDKLFARADRAAAIRLD